MIYNNLDQLLTEIQYSECQADATCTANFILCFHEKSTIVECDSDRRATNKVWTIEPEQLVEEPTLVGQAWRWNESTKELPCYIATISVETLDGRSALI